MEPTDAKRRVSAILMSGVDSYSRLMGYDEAATVRTLTEFREVFISLHSKPRRSCGKR